MWNISKKKCIIFLIFHTVCIIFLFYFCKDKFILHKNENCTVQSISLLKTEQIYSKNVDDYLKNFFKNATLRDIKVSQKWTLMTNNVYVYSAFFEKCPSYLSQQFCVKFIGIVLSNISSLLPFKSSVKCATQNDSFIFNRYATIQILPESHKKIFTASYLFCPVTNNFHPTHASLYKVLSNLTWIPVENYSLPNVKKHNLSPSDIKLAERISLCVRPFYNGIDFLLFSEFLAYYSVMGVDHFIFYYINSFKPQQMFLNYIKFTNLSQEVFLWDIPLDNDLVHEYGQIAFTQDCLSRSKSRFTHTIIVDLDEYIVPNYHKDIKSLVSFLDEQNTLAGSYVIPSALFCIEYVSENSHIFPFHILNHRKRQKTIWYHGYRSKYILRPDRVKYSGVHSVWEFEENYQEVFVSPEVALLNHYRFCCGVGQTWILHLLEFKVLNDYIVIDNSLVEHEKELLNHPLLKFLIYVT